MLKVSFLNVLQGDSIVIEYNKKEDSNDYSNICILDSNINKLPKNPTLQILKDGNYQEIDFIILSHPHYDHYSGLSEILEYCKKNNIVINNFLHSCEQVPDYLKSIPNSNISNNELWLLFFLIKTLKKEGLIKKHFYIKDSTQKIKLTNNIYMDFLSPSTFEAEKFVSGVPLYRDEEIDSDNSKANWLCIITRISNSETGNFILFTSDAESKSLKRIRKDIEIINNPYITLELAQCPHHGAKGNLYKFFWKHINRNNNTPYVISVGDNQYKHPSIDVIKFASENNYKVLSTNQVGCLTNELIPAVEMDKENAISVISKKNLTSKNDNFNGDKVFEFDSDLKLLTNY